MKALVLGLALALSGQARAEVALVLASVSEAKSYGLLVSAPETGCAAMRVFVRGEGGLLGQSGTVRAGQVAVVRMGRGFAEGDHQLTMEGAGCKVVPVAKRWVVLGKASPDHGWRAGVIR